MTNPSPIFLPSSIRDITPSITTLYTVLAAASSTAPTVQETHGAWVVLTEEADGNYAYKLKKPVAFPYMDYSTPAKRKVLSHREVELNSRTAAALYIGVLALTENGLVEPFAAPAEAPDTLVDWVVKMHRFDEAALLSNVAEAGNLTAELVNALSQQIMEFHKTAAKHSNIDGFSPITATIKGNDAMFANFRDHLDRPTTNALTIAQLAMAEALKLPLNDRAANGWVRQCHGDLYLNNICLWPNNDSNAEPLLFDCIEFNDAFAVIDTQYDVAFLLMDLYFREMPNAATLIQQQYTASMPMVQADLWPLLISIRAAIRSHVSVAMGDVPLAQQYLQLALDSVQEPQRFGAPAA